MKTLFTHKPMMRTALAICLAGAFAAACSNDDSATGVGGGPAPADITANYSNKLAYGNRANLALTYSGDSLIGKDVTFKTDDSKTAELTLNNILPHENATTIKDVALTPDGKSGYSFKGSSTSPLNTTFDYSGTITKGKLSLDITNAKVPGNEIGTLKLVEPKTLDVDSSKPDENGNMAVYQTYHTNIYVHTDKDSLAMLGLQVGSIFDKILNLYLLKDVTFAEDGNITAHYSTLPEGFSMQDFSKIYSYTPNPWKESPKNLATWYSNKDTMYVTPNIDMIIRQVQKDKQTSRAGLPDISSLKNLYAALNQWSTTGVKLIFKENPWKNDYVFSVSNTLPNGTIMNMYIKYEGDYLIYINKEDLMPLVPVLQSLLTDDLVKTIVSQSGGFLKENYVRSIPRWITEAKYLEIGLFFNK